MATKNSNTQQDLGFGTQGRRGYRRLINPNGDFNVRREGVRVFLVYDIYIELIKMPWWKFNIMVVILYSSLNLFFAFLYYLVGLENLTGVNPENNFEAFMDAFFFSAQTLTTVGYGRIAPMHVPASTIAAIESLMGLMGFALATGLLYGRFSRPSAKILYSKNMLVVPHNGGTALMFRIANSSKNQLIDSEMSIFLAYQELEADGRSILRYKALELELKTIQYLSLSWTLVHMLDEKSPLYQWTQKDFEEKNIEILVTFKGIDDTFMQHIHDRTSYKYDEIIWGAKFTRMFEPSDEGQTVLHLDWIDKYEIVELPILNSANQKTMLN